MEAVLYDDEAAARAAIEECNRRKGFPRVEEGVRFGGGRFVASIVTESVAEPIPAKGGRWAVPADAIDAAVQARVEFRDADVDVEAIEKAVETREAAIE